MKRKLTSKQIDAALDRLTRAVLAALPREGRVAVVGIRTRGETLAQRLVERLQTERPGLGIDRGVLDITFYRDDLGAREGAPLVRSTQIDFDINDAWILLVDDVLHTGRSVRAALDALHDFGRPRLVRLAVLIDRLGRQLPIAADFVGRKLSAPEQQRIQVLLKENDGKEGVYIIPQE